MTIPNFKPQNIVGLVKKHTKMGLEATKQAQKGNDWQAVFDPLDATEFKLNRVTNVNAHLNSVCFSEKFNQMYEKTLPILTDYYHQISTDKKLYRAFLQLKKIPLSGEQNYILDNVLQDFELSGLNLSGKLAQKFKKISQQLSLLGNQFFKNTLQATNEWQYIVSEDDLGGDYPTHLLIKLDQDGQYVANLQVPIYVDIMTYANSELLRKSIYCAYISRASEVGITDKKYDNTQVMSDILALRQQKANLLGFENYAQLSLCKKMVKQPAEVIDFLEDLIQKIKPKAEAELKELTMFVGTNINIWDVNFYSEKLKQARYGFSKAELRPYFPEEQVLSGLFALIKNLYQIDTRRLQEKTYHPEVKVFKLCDKNSEEIGKIYLDTYARNNKRGGAWMVDYQGLYGTNKPIAFVVCNLNAPTGDSPALFDFDEVVTLFHEFGHALHHLLTTTPYPSVAGINGVPWDGVELPSQMMELFCYEHWVIDQISGHYQTGKKLPQNLYQKLCSSANFHSGMQLLRQCEFAMWDIKVHLNSQDSYQVLSEVRKKTAIIQAVKENRFLNSFGHIFSGGYAAGYYSYLWAEVLAADAFFYLKAKQFKATVVQSFRENILAVGGSVDFAAQYQKFRGKLPNIDTLLKSKEIL